MCVRSQNSMQAALHNQLRCAAHNWKNDGPFQDTDSRRRRECVAVSPAAQWIVGIFLKAIWKNKQTVCARQFLFVLRKQIGVTRSEFFP